MDEGGGVVYGARFRAVAYVARRPWATVFRAADAVSGGAASVTVVPADLVPGPTLFSHLQVEVDRLAGVTHPNLAPVVAMGEDEGAVWVAEPWEDGATLAEVIAARGPLPAGQVATILSDLAAGLAVAHEAGVVHGGPSPADVWLVGSPGGPARLHGLALQHALVLASLDAGAPPVGERAYLAPERAAGAPGAPAADLYGLGALGFEALTGQPPFPREGRAEGAAPPFPSDLVPGVPPGLEDVVLDLIEPDPADRHHYAEELREELEPFVLARDGAAPLPAREQPTAGPPVPPLPPADLELDPEADMWAELDPEPELLAEPEPELEVEVEPERDGGSEAPPAPVLDLPDSDELWDAVPPAGGDVDADLGLDLPNGPETSAPRRRRVTPLIGAGVVAALLALVAVAVVLIDRQSDDGSQTEQASDTGGVNTTAPTEVEGATAEGTTTAPVATAEVPDQIGNGLFQAVAALEAAGFTVVTEIRVDPALPRGSVVEQEPSGGAQPVGSEVRIVYTEPVQPPA